MITEQDLQAAIAECQGVRNPNASTCIKLAAYYTIKDHLYPEKTQIADRSEELYSYAPEPQESTVYIDSTSDFAQAVNGRREAEIWSLVDELVSTVRVVNPRLYASFMSKIE